MCLTDNFWATVVVGVTNGFIYALIALGYTLVYGVLQLLNFAHSEVFMAGAFGGLFFTLAVLGRDGEAHGMMSAVMIVGGLLAGGVFGGAVAFVLERVAYRPLRRRNAPRLAYLISAIGASFFLINIFGKMFGRMPIKVPDLYKNGTVFTVFGAAISVRTCVIAISAIAMLVLLDYVVNKTRLGQGIRAVAQDADTASLMGVNIDRVISQTFVVGGLLGGAAGFLYGGLFVNVQNTMGFLPGLKAFSAAVLGGIGNVRGAMLGGLLLGLVENFTVVCTQAAWNSVVAFLVLVLVLLFRPTGILGERLGRSA
jgi:branched-chain amino acid transport system permease protein